MKIRTFRSRQQGGALSLLLVLVIIGLAAYFALRSHSTTTGGSQQQLVSCERVMSDLIKRTGGIGPDYKAGYDAAPAQCRSMLPPPGAIEPPHQAGDQ